VRLDESSLKESSVYIETNNIVEELSKEATEDAEKIAEDFE